MENGQDVGVEADGVLRRVHQGSAPESPSWVAIEHIFDASFGVDAHGLPRQPNSIAAGWVDGEGRHFRAETLEDLRIAYASSATHTLHFSGTGHGRHADFEMQPGGRARALLAIKGPDDVVSAAIAAAKAAFPLPFGGAVIFLSWSGLQSRSVAEALGGVLRDRFPSLTVFVSSSSIEPGDDPMKRMLDESLLECQVLIALLTKEAASKPWVLWETAAAWARKQLVIPVFVDIEPEDVPGPLTSRVQGVHLRNVHAMGRALTRIADRFGFPPPDPLSADEHASLEQAASDGA